jgi:hypothetical protein
MIPPIESEPRIDGIKCKVMVYALYFVLMIVPILAGVWVWSVYNIWIAILVWLFSFLVTSIVGSKLRLLSLPPDQRERSLSSLEISKWYIGKNHCF